MEVFLHFKLVGLWCLTSLSTIFQLYRGGAFQTDNVTTEVRLVLHTHMMPCFVCDGLNVIFNRSNHIFC